jgi:thioredoxin 1
LLNLRYHIEQMKNIKNIAILLLITAIGFGLPNRGNAQTVKNDKIYFIEDAWAAALKQAAAENKYIFVDAYASWCGPCKMLKATSFKDAKVAAFYNKNFVNVSLDMEKGVGPKLAAEWQLEAYPTLIIFTPKGKAVLGSVGYIKANELLKFGKEALAKKM